MHKYLRAIGFSQVVNRGQSEELMKYVITNSSERIFTSHDDEYMFAEYRKAFAKEIGIIARGEFDEHNHFYEDFYFPYILGTKPFSSTELSVERHAEKETYAGICDDIKDGVSLIFYLQNVLDYFKMNHSSRALSKELNLFLSALSVSGMIVMPLSKNEIDVARDKKATASRKELLKEAKRGNEEAIETLTLEDMDTYSNLSRRILKEDIYTLVDTYFMPCGVECDHYSVLGEILSLQFIENELTKERLCHMMINCNDICFDLCINEKDLLGEPKVGRRFKGIVWLQGMIEFP